MSLGKIFGGGDKPDTSQYDQMVADANARAAEAKTAAEKAAQEAKEREEELKRQQALEQNEVADANKNRRAAASNRFSLLLFEDDLLGL